MQIETKLQELAAELEQLRQNLTPPAAADRYAEGYAAGVRDCHQAVVTAVREALNSVAKQLHAAPPAVAPTPHSTPKTQPSSPVASATARISAPIKDRLVREHLASHPGATYNDLAQALSKYTATRVYALIDRGDVFKDDDKRFYLTDQGRSRVTGAANDQPSPERQQLP